MGKLLKWDWDYLKGLWQGIIAAKKWIIAYVVLILLPITIMLASYYQRSSVILEREVTRSMQQTLRQAGMNLTYKLNHVLDINNSVFMNKELYNSLLPQSSITGQLEQMMSLRNLADTVQTNMDIMRFRIFVDESRLYAGDRINLFPMSMLEKRPWYKEIAGAGGGMVWTGVYREDYLDTEAKDVFSVGRVLRNPQQYEEILGVLMLDIPDQVLKEVMSGINFSTVYTPYIMDKDGSLIYTWSDADDATGRVHADGFLQEDAKQTVLQTDEGIIKRTEGRENVYVMFTTIKSNGWKLLAEVSQAEIAHRAVAQNQFTSIATVIAITVLFLVLVFVLLTFTIQGLTKRIQVVLKMMRKEGVGWLEEHRHAPEGDFRLLERSVDQLIRKVNNLMEETYQAKVLEREAQLKALQAQINPHFLYNTLDMINWSAIAHDAEDTSQMIEALAQYFRLSLNKGKDNVSVADELDLARVYLEIQQNRFPSTFTFHIEVQPDLECYLIPKLTLQPLVENALLHGIRKAKDKKGTIRITAKLENETLLLSVADDGIGMEEETAKKLLLLPRPDMRADGSGSSYGLYNVNERLRIFAGEQYGLSIETTPGQGTTIHIRVKAIQAAPAGTDGKDLASGPEG
ncbi:sensor histidine kinase [Paenibacillus sp. YN15]|uniref:cache domain-containing sensor histidine kinase n=1 Tax=Paenibacillus sp. YN15 TaxID=1742774 RepID=UPI000DCB7C92|nr:sensor histidine kinase [Paenibacillus sp. YN15]RAV04138.1 sensor histidine kinase [Paenibacillus sp. YN15]